MPKISDMVAVQRPDGTIVLMPRDVAPSDEKEPSEFTKMLMREPGDDETQREEELMYGRGGRWPAAVAASREAVVPSERLATEAARRDVLRGEARPFARSVEDISTDVEGASPTPFTDVRRGIGERLVNSAQSDYIDPEELARYEEIRRRKLGI